MQAYIGDDKKGKVLYPLENLKKHFVALGGSGSGKTVLSKVIIEEAALNGIPSILVDPQGDLASLMIPGKEKDVKGHGLSPETLRRFKEDVEVVVFTPMSSKGIPLCINPLHIEAKGDSEEMIPVINEISLSIAKLLGYNTENDKGKAASAILYTVLRKSYEDRKPIGSFQNLIDVLSSPDGDISKAISDFSMTDKDMDSLKRKIKFLTVGQKDLMFQMGVPLDVDTLIGKGKKTQISVIYLNTIPSQQEKEFFISILSTNIYQWMLSNPSSNLQFIYYIDEAAPYIPAGSEKPMPKPILMLLYKQARKYGVGCMVATQNPGDIDYKALAQFGSWAIGRLTVKQDQKKVESALKSLSSIDISSHLPRLTPGRFILFSPDLSDKLIDLKARWLYTEHKTLNDITIAKVMTDAKRDRFKNIIRKASHEIASDAHDPDDNQRVKNNQVQKSEEERKEDGPKHFPLLHDETAVRRLIHRYKRRYFMIGPVKEDLAQYKLTMHPFYKLKVAKSMMRLLKREQRIYEILVDAVKGSVVTKRIGFRWHDNFSFYKNLNDNDLTVLKFLHTRVMPVSAAEISLKTHLSQAVCKRSLLSMQKQKVVGFRKQGKHQLWFSTLIDAHADLYTLSSKISNLTTEKVQATYLKEKVSLKQIERIFSNLYDGAHVAEHEIVYLPIHMIEYTSDNGSRRIYINGYTAKIINP